MLDRITSMRVFVRATSAGSLSAAARHQGMSPAMATKHVDALEAHLGVKLFHRSTRRLTLTEAGNRYLEACQRILGDIDEAEATISSQRFEASGLLRLNVPLTFGIHYIAPILFQFSRRHPAVKVELGLSDSQVDLIDGGWDMAVRIGKLGDSSLQARKLGDVPLVLCAAPAYLDSRGVPRRVADLAQHNCLTYNLATTGSAHEWIFGRNGDIRAKVDGDLVANNGEALLAAAVQGQGLIYQPLFIVVESLRRGELVALELDQPPQVIDGIYILYPPDRRPPAKVRVMIDFLVETYGGTQPWTL
ncbi:LysR family transcriptional regulator [Pseudomonas saudiphocaensis]|uniref:LysR family transcriptional regulator n=1 Tax=Pseudomonas saudiphocaensis TaxID=1499686 RepID=A0A078LL29_9PSED|nr:LysR family transcriptional regulator [Pseudomonas saudiphocaensis]RRV16907.1 LysR family transcriptional regulator [Pseudomonas saudiphocaensis]CDZ93333.1 LysR family transcriptional regulator [Pseudomonas saudiphocaensis]